MQLYNETFNTAQENMQFDCNLLDLHQQQNSPFLRIYKWKSTGLTQSEKRPFPVTLSKIDHASRITGGGLVFHCPEDIVFSQGAPINHPAFPKKLKDRCQWFANTIQQWLLKANIQTSFQTEKATDTQNIHFCTSYHNPYELLFNNSKIMGLAVKKTRDWIFFQGIINCKPSYPYFSTIEKKYHRYFSKGIPQSTISLFETMIPHIKSELKKPLQTNSK